MNPQLPEPTQPRRYRWPWVVLAFFLLGVALTVYAVRREAKRVMEQREPRMEDSRPASQ